MASSSALGSENPTSQRGRSPGRQPASRMRALPQPPATQNTASVAGSAQARSSWARREASGPENHRHRPIAAAGTSRVQPASAQRRCNSLASCSPFSHQVPGATATKRLPWRSGGGSGSSAGKPGATAGSGRRPDAAAAPKIPSPPARPVISPRRRTGQPRAAASRRRPSMPPVAGSQARSGWGIRPSTLPAALVKPATSPTEPLGLAP